MCTHARGLLDELAGVCGTNHPFRVLHGPATADMHHPDVGLVTVDRHVDRRRPLERTEVGQEVTHLSVLVARWPSQPRARATAAKSGVRRQAPMVERVEVEPGAEGEHQSLAPG